MSLPWGGVVVPPQSDHRKNPGDGAASRPCWASPSSPASPGSVGPRPHTRWAPGPGPGGARGSAARPSPVPGCPALRSGLQRCFRPPSAPRGRLARARLRRLGPRPLGLRLPLRGTARFVPRSLARPIGAGALRLAPAGAPPGGPRLRAGPRPGSAPSRLAPPGPLRGAFPVGASASPFGALRAPYPVALGPSPGSALALSGPLPPPRVPPCPPPAFGRGVLALWGSARARCARGAARPFGPLLGGSAAPRALGPRGVGAACWRHVVVDGGHLRWTNAPISAR